MTTYRTGNPLGSKDPRDLYDNAENFDAAINDVENPSFEDRFGRQRTTLKGYDDQFQQFLLNSGYENVGDYGPGLEITARNQIFWRDGELYRAGAALELPYTTTGDWGAEGGLFVAVGDAALRQELADPDMGAAMVARSIIVVNSVSEMMEMPGIKVGSTVQTKGYYTPGDGGGNTYEVVAAGTGVDDGGSFIDLPDSGLQAKAIFAAAPRLSQFGAAPGNDAAAPWAKLCAYAQASGQTIAVDGSFDLSAAYALASGKMVIEGVTADAALIPSSADGIFTGTSDDDIVISNLSIKSGNSLAGVFSTSRAQGGYHRLVMSNVSIRSQSGMPFASGITLNNVGNIYMHQVDAYMADTDKTQCSHFLDISGSGPGFITNFVMSDSKIFMCEKGIKVSSSNTISTSGFEGFKLLNTDIVAVKKGVLVDHHEHEPDYLIQGCHINFDDKGIDFVGAGQTRIRNNLIYCQSTNANAVFIHVKAARSAGPKALLIDVTGNQLYDIDVDLSGKAVSATGVWLENAQFFNVLDNQMQNMASGILVGGSSSWGSLSRNTFINGASGSVMVLLQSGVSNTSSYGNTYINVPNPELNQGAASNITDGSSNSAAINRTRLESRSMVVTTDASGAFTQNFESPFPAKPVVTATFSDVSTGGITMSVDDANTNTSSFRITTHPALANATFRLNYFAFCKS